MHYIKRADTSSVSVDRDETRNVVREIIADVRARGDEALREYETRFSQVERPQFRITDDEWERAIASLDEDVKTLVDRSTARVTAFAEAQLATLHPLEMELGDGIVLGHRHVPLETAGAYVPGGRFPLLSSAQMVTVPAKVAGVKRVVALSPANYQGSIHPAVLYALKRAGATDVFAIGGAQAIAAMAYGTESVPRVDLIAGPGNRFVAEAKRQVYGDVGIDLIAGPSEILVIADDTADAHVVAVDLLAQAEHDPYSRAILISTSHALAEAVAEEVETVLAALPEDSPARHSWPRCGEIISVQNPHEAFSVGNDYAMEHVHIQMAEPRRALDALHNYGSLFIGEPSSVVFSDKVSGTNHTLPTLQAARYTGGLWVGTYIKTLTYQEVREPGTQYLARHSELQSRREGLEGHRLSAAIRIR